MIDGIITPDLQDLDEVMPHAPYPVYPTGQKDADKSHAVAIQMISIQPCRL